jgi:hypothetical protein
VMCFCILVDSTQSLGTYYKMQHNFFFDRIPQITKYCVMRECENILRGYLYDGNLVFVILKGIYGFKFPHRFLKISSRDLTSSILLQLI